MNISFKIFFFLITFFAAGSSTQAQDWDTNLLRDIYQIDSKGFSNATANSAYIIPTATTAGILIYGIIKKDNLTLERGLTLGAGLAVNTVVTLGLKKLIGRKRPYMTYPDIVSTKPESSASFPSGHTSTAFNFATSLSLQYPKWYIIAPSFAWATAVGYARINQGVHYPTDVLGGMVVGSGCAVATFYANKWIRKEWAKRKTAASNLSYY